MYLSLKYCVYLLTVALCLSCVQARGCRELKDCTSCTKPSSWLTGLDTKCSYCTVKVTRILDNDKEMSNCFNPYTHKLVDQCKELGGEIVEYGKDDQCPSPLQNDVKIDSWELVDDEVQQTGEIKEAGANDIVNQKQKKPNEQQKHVAGQAVPTVAIRGNTLGETFEQVNSQNTSESFILPKIATLKTKPVSTLPGETFKPTDAKRSPESLTDKVVPTTPGNILSTTRRDRVSEISPDATFEQEATVNKMMHQTKDQTLRRDDFLSTTASSPVQDRKAGESITTKSSKRRRNSKKTFVYRAEPEPDSEPKSSMGAAKTKDTNPSHMLKSTAEDTLHSLDVSENDMSEKEWTPDHMSKSKADAYKTVGSSRDAFQKVEKIFEGYMSGHTETDPKKAYLSVKFSLEECLHHQKVARLEMREQNDRKTEESVIRRIALLYYFIANLHHKNNNSIEALKAIEDAIETKPRGTFVNLKNKIETDVGVIDLLSHRFLRVIEM